MPSNNNNNRRRRNNENLSKKFFSKLTNYDKDGKGVKKKKVTDKELFSLKSFFMVYKNNFWNLIILNMIFMLMISPALAGLLSFRGIGLFHTRVPTPSNVIFAPLYGAQVASPTVTGANLLGIYGTQTAILVSNNITQTLSWIMMIVFLTFGPANVGLTYILRAYTRREYVFLWRDFFGTIKKNFISGILMGAGDLALMVMLVFSTMFYYYSPGANSTIFFLMLFGMGVIYAFMRFYLYILLITFKLPPLKLYKNAFILAFLGIKRNVAGLCGILLFSMLCVLILMFSVPFGITLPFFFLVSNSSFAACFAAWKNVKEIMIDPFYEHKDGEKYELKIEEAPIFIDRG